MNVVHKKLGKKFSFLTSKVTLHIKSTFIIPSIWCKTGTSIPRDHTTFIFQSSEKKKKRLGTHSKFLLRSMRSLKFFFFAKMLWQSSKKMSSFYQHTWRLFLLIEMLNKNSGIKNYQFFSISQYFIKIFHCGYFFFIF